MEKVNDGVVYICNEDEGDQVTFSDRDTSNGFCGHKKKTICRLVVMVDDGSYIHINTFSYTYIHAYIRAFIHAYKQVHAFVHTYIRVCVYIYQCTEASACAHRPTLCNS